MKLKFILIVLALMGTATVFAQKKSGIISFNITGKERRTTSVSGYGNAEVNELYFIGDNSTMLSDSSLTSDVIVRYTEAGLKDLLGYDLVPINLQRPKNVPAQMDGTMMVMETITEKNAFTKLGYDEAIIVNARIFSNGKTGKGYKPGIEITIKVVDKNGKTTLKKSEKLKLEDEKVEARLIEYTESGNVSMSDMFNMTKKNDGKAGSEGAEGVSSMKVLDWYKQCFSNLVLPKQ